MLAVYIVLVLLHGQTVAATAEKPKCDETQDDTCLFALGESTPANDLDATPCRVCDSSACIERDVHGYYSL